MFNWTTPSEKTGLEEARDTLLSEMQNFEGHDEQYEKMVAHLKTISDLIANEKAETLSPNTAAMVLGNIGAVLLVVVYEGKNVWTSKALGVMMKFIK